MGFDVKITTFSGFLDLLAPHSCRGCGHLGGIFCECCKNYNIKQEIRLCAHCKRPFAPTKKSIPYCHCQVPVYTAFYREGLMMELVEDYKYQSIRDAAKVLAELLDSLIPLQLTDVSIVPLPTAPKHIRSRGFDHTLRLAKELIKIRNRKTSIPNHWSVERLLSRQTNTVQVGTTEEVRKKQAQSAYDLSGKVNANQTYLLLDDVWTTGASMESAIKILQKAGAKHLFGTVLLVSR